jgi:hypothetical protein
MPRSIAANSATFRKKAVFPTLGRPATVTRFPRWNPAVMRSRSG